MNDKITLEELGTVEDVTLEVDVSFDVTQPEPMVRYYPDGSGYPGCDGEFEWTEFTVTRYTSQKRTMGRCKKHKEFFEFLDREAQKIIEQNERWQEHVLE